MLLLGTFQILCRCAGISGYWFPVSLYREMNCNLSILRSKNQEYLHTCTAASGVICTGMNNDHQ